jgi:hypothetical protein
MAILTIRQKQHLLGYFGLVLLACFIAGLVWQFFVQAAPLAWTILALIVACLVAWVFSAALTYRRRRSIAAREIDPGEVPVYDNDTVDSLAMRIVDANREAGVPAISLARARRRAAEALARFNGA